MTTSNEYKISRKAKDGKTFSLTGVKCVEDGKWYILEDECGIERNTKEQTSEAMRICLANKIEDYNSLI
jgi:hypothetical protein